MRNRNIGREQIKSTDIVYPEVRQNEKTPRVLPSVRKIKDDLTLDDINNEQFPSWFNLLKNFETDNLSREIFNNNYFFILQNSEKIANTFKPVFRCDSNPALSMFAEKTLKAIYIKKSTVILTNNMLENLKLHMENLLNNNLLSISVMKKHIQLAGFQEIYTNTLEYLENLFGLSEKKPYLGNQKDLELIQKLINYQPPRRSTEDGNSPWHTLRYIALQQTVSMVFQNYIIEGKLWVHKELITLEKGNNLLAGILMMIEESESAHTKKDAKKPEEPGDHKPFVKSVFLPVEEEQTKDQIMNNFIKEFDEANTEFDMELAEKYRKQQKNFMNNEEEQLKNTESLFGDPLKNMKMPNEKLKYDPSSKTFSGFSASMDPAIASLLSELVDGKTLDDLFAGKKLSVEQLKNAINKDVCNKLIKEIRTRANIQKHRSVPVSGPGETWVTGLEFTIHSLLLALQAIAFIYLSYPIFFKNNSRSGVWKFIMMAVTISLGALNTVEVSQRNITSSADLMTDENITKINEAYTGHLFSLFTRYFKAKSGDGQQENVSFWNSENIFSAAAYITDSMISPLVSFGNWFGGKIYSQDFADFANKWKLNNTIYAKSVGDEGKLFVKNDRIMRFFNSNAEITFTQRLLSVSTAVNTFLLLPGLTILFDIYAANVGWFLFENFTELVKQYANITTDWMYFLAFLAPLSIYAGISAYDSVKNLNFLLPSDARVLQQEDGDENNNNAPKKSTQHKSLGSKGTVGAALGALDSLHDIFSYFDATKILWNIVTFMVKNGYDIVLRRFLAVFQHKVKVKVEQEQNWFLDNVGVYLAEAVGVHLKKTIPMETEKDNKTLETIWNSNVNGGKFRDLIVLWLLGAGSYYMGSSTPLMAYVYLRTYLYHVGITQTKYYSWKEAMLEIGTSVVSPREYVLTRMMLNASIDYKKIQKTKQKIINTMNDALAALPTGAGPKKIQITSPKEAFEFITETYITIKENELTKKDFDYMMFHEDYEHLLELAYLYVRSCYYF